MAIDGHKLSQPQAQLPVSPSCSNPQYSIPVQPFLLPIQSCPSTSGRSALLFLRSMLHPHVCPRQSLTQGGGRGGGTAGARRRGYILPGVEKLPQQE
eukprot:768166-Hanusia_phi.AAC.2